MKTLTIVILYDKNSEERIPLVKESILKGINEEDVNFVNYFTEEERYVIANETVLRNYDSKYITVVHAKDNVFMADNIVNQLKKNNYYVLYGYIDIVYLDGKTEVANDLIYNNCFIYGKIIRIDWILNNYIINNFYISLIFNKPIPFGTKRILSFKYYYYYRETKYDFVNEELQSEIYMVDGIEYNIYTQFNTIIPLAKEFLSLDEFFEMNYSATVNIPIILDNRSLDGSTMELFKFCFNNKEILNALIVYNDKKGTPISKNILSYLIESMETDSPTPSINIIIDLDDNEKISRLKESIESNISIKHKVYIKSDYSDISDLISTLENEYTWIIKDNLDIKNIDFSIQTYDCPFVLFNQEKDKAVKVENLEESVSTENMWIKTEVLKKQNTLDFKLDEGFIMFNVRNIYK